MACAFWPVAANGTAGPVHAPGTPPVLVVGTTRDPVTPYTYSVSLARQFPRDVLLTRVGDGHTAYGTSTCATDAIEDNLLTLRTRPPTPPAATREPSTPGWCRAGLMARKHVGIVLASASAGATPPADTRLTAAGRKARGTTQDAMFGGLLDRRMLPLIAELWSLRVRERND